MSDTGSTDPPDSHDDPDNQPPSSDDGALGCGDTRLGFQHVRRDRLGRYAFKRSDDPHGWFLFGPPN